MTPTDPLSGIFSTDWSVEVWGVSTIWMVVGLALPFVYSSHVYEGALLPRLVFLQVGLLLLCGVATFNQITLNRKILIPTAALLISMALSATQSLNYTESILQLAQYGPLVLIPVLVSATLTPDHFHRCVTIWTWGSIPIALIGISQYFGLGWEDLPSSANPSATFFHRNAAAEYLIAIIPFGWYLAHLADTRRKRISYTTITSICCAYLVFTRCRGAWIGIGVASLVVWLIYRRVAGLKNPRLRPFRKWISPTIAVVIVLAAFLPDRISTPGSQHFDEKKDSALAALTSIADGSGHRGRLSLWAHTVTMSLDHPLLGVGLGNWEYVYPEYARGDQVNVNASPRRPHNDFLWILSETGVVGLAAFLGFLFFVFRSGFNALSSPSSRPLAAACLVVVLAHLGDGLFNFPRERITPAFLFWFSAGGLLRLDPRQARPEVGRWGLALAGLLLLATTYVTVNRLNYDVHHLKVYRAEREQAWDEVIRSGERASAIGDYRANTFIAMGRAHERQGRPSQAVDAHRRALTLHPNSLNAHNNLAIALRKTGDLDGAERAAKRAIELLPSFKEAHNNLGNVHRDRQDWPEAIASFERALEIDPYNAVIRVNLGRALASSGDPYHAELQFRNAIALSPENLPAQRALKELLESKR